ncbi:MAG: hypothetical protein NT011_07470 [Kiritimatiellaeota bacterium]|nr:hypothetical protein [Kiritimatiellota bacterium]
MTNPPRTDTQILRDLAQCVADIAAQPEQQQKREAVKALNRLDQVLPRVYCFPEGAWLECIPPASLQCADPVLRGWEMRLRMAIYTHEFFRDDQPIDAVFNVPWDGRVGGCGLNIGITATDAAVPQTYFLHPYSNLTGRSSLGAVHYDAPLRERHDIDKLRTPQLHINPETSGEWLTLAHELFDGILAVRRRGHWWQTVGGVCQTAMMLRGMDTLMIDMLDDPQWVQEFIGRLAAGHLAVLDQLEAGNYLSLNNGCEWIHTGGIGCSDELPPAGHDPARVRCRDLWGGEQSQDLIGISPALFEELFFPHLQPIVERFGLGCYGCCEPLHDWIPVLRRIRNLRRISISPWADIRKSAERIGREFVLSCKPLPTVVCTERMDEAAIRRHLVEVFTITRRHDCRVEVMLKDLHTVRHEPERLRRWVELAKQARTEVYG